MTETTRARLTLADLRRANREGGGCWFEPSTMRFFRSRILPTVYQGPGGVFFVSSEQFDDASPRNYTVRQFEPTSGAICTFGPFNELGRGAAITLAKRAASGDEAARAEH